MSKLQPDRRTTVGDFLHHLDQAHRQTLGDEDAGEALRQDLEELGAAVEAVSPARLTEKVFQLLAFLWTVLLFVTCFVGTGYVFDRVKVVDLDGNVHQVDMMAVLTVVYFFTNVMTWLVGFHAYGGELLRTLARPAIWIHNVPYGMGLISAFSLLQANSYLAPSLVAVLTRPRILVDAILGYLVLNQKFTSVKTLLLVLVMLTVTFHALAKQEAQVAQPAAERATEWGLGLLFVGLTYIAPFLNAYTSFAQKKFELQILPSVIVYSLFRTVAAAAFTLTQNGTTGFRMLTNPLMIVYMLVYTVYDLNYFLVLPIISPIGISLAGAVAVSVTYVAEIMVFDKAWQTSQGFTAVQTGILVMAYVLYENNHLKKPEPVEPKDDAQKALLNEA